MVAVPPDVHQGAPQTHCSPRMHFFSCNSFVSGVISCVYTHLISLFFPRATVAAPERSFPATRGRRRSSGSCHANISPGFGTATSRTPKLLPRGRSLESKPTFGQRRPIGKRAAPRGCRVQAAGPGSQGHARRGLRNRGVLRPRGDQRDFS